MRYISYRPSLCLLAAAIVCHLAFSAQVSAQSAWTPLKGTYSLAISYQNNFSDRHTFGNGQDYLTVFGQKFPDLGSVRVQAAYVDLGYAFTDKLSVGFDLPYMASKYTKPSVFPVGPNGPVNTFGPHTFWDPAQPSLPPTIPIDNGQYHGGIQDLGFRLRYNVTDHPFMITPFLQYSVPSHGYEFYSHSVYGNRIAEFQIGTFLGGFVASNAYLAGGYGLGFPQTVDGISRKHQHMELEGGYFFNEKIKAFGILHAQVTNGGVDLIQDPSSDNKPPLLFEGFGFPAQCGSGQKPCGYTSADTLFMHHLQVQRDSFLNMSAGMEYSFNTSMSVYGVLEHTLVNRNLHVLKYGLTFGVSWGFGGAAQRPCHC